MTNIFSKKAYRFSVYDNGKRIKSFDVPRSIITRIPEWVQNDPLFNMAVKAGNINIMGTSANANLNVVDALVAEAKSLGIKNPNTMTLDALQKAMDDVKNGVKQEKATDKSPSKEELLKEATALGIEKAAKMNITQLTKAIAEAKEQQTLDTDTDDSDTSDDEEETGE